MNTTNKAATKPWLSEVLDFSTLLCATEYSSKDARQSKHATPPAESAREHTLSDIAITIAEDDLVSRPALGDFNRVWEFLGFPKGVPPPPSLKFAEEPFPIEKYPVDDGYSSDVVTYSKPREGRKEDAYTNERKAEAASDFLRTSDTSSSTTPTQTKIRRQKGIQKKIGEAEVQSKKSTESNTEAESIFRRSPSGKKGALANSANIKIDHDINLPPRDSSYHANVNADHAFAALLGLATGRVAEGLENMKGSYPLIIDNGMPTILSTNSIGDVSSPPSAPSVFDSQDVELDDICSRGNSTGSQQALASRNKGAENITETRVLSKAHKRSGGPLSPRNHVVKSTLQAKQAKSTQLQNHMFAMKKKEGTNENKASKKKVNGEMANTKKTNANSSKETGKKTKKTKKTNANKTTTIAKGSKTTGKETSTSKTNANKTTTIATGSKATGEKINTSQKNANGSKATGEKMSTGKTNLNKTATIANGSKATGEKMSTGKTNLNKTATIANSSQATGKKMSTGKTNLNKPATIATGSKATGEKMSTGKTNLNKTATIANSSQATGKKMSTGKTNLNKPATIANSSQATSEEMSTSKTDVNANETKIVEQKYAIKPKLNYTADDRNWTLLQKLVNRFSEDKPRLVNPMNLITHQKNHSEGIHVFVDASNIFIGFTDRLKRVRGIPESVKLPQADISFDSLALLMERRRPVAKRVLVGSTPHLSAFDIAKAVGYDCSILEKVFKARKLTDRQVVFNECDRTCVKSTFKPVLALSKLGFPNPTNSNTVRESGNESGQDREPQYGPKKNIEQGVDEVLHLKMAESIFDFEPSTIVLATGDAAEAEYSQGFLAMVARALRYGWNVELVSWKRSLSSMYRCRELIETGRFRIIFLDDFAEELLDM